MSGFVPGISIIGISIGAKLPCKMSDTFRFFKSLSFNYPSLLKTGKLLPFSPSIILSGALTLASLPLASFAFDCIYSVAPF